MGCGKSKAAEETNKDGTEAAGADNKAADAATAAGDGETATTGPKVIVVFGATGAQGGSVVRALKGDDKFHVKAVTRNPDSDKAKALTEEGIEVIKADMDDAESIKPVLQDAYGVFLVTNYWEHMDKDRELQQGKNVVDAAKQCGVQHLVYSGAALNAKEPIDKQAKNIEAKIATRTYIMEQDVPSTCVMMATYYENLLGTFKPKKNDNHEYVLALPMGDKPLDMVCVAEVGECIHQMFARPDEFKGQTIGLCSQRFTLEEYAAILSKAFDTKKFVAGNVTLDEYSKLDVPGAEDLAVMFELNQTERFDFDIELTRRLNPNISTFEQWVDNNKDNFDSELD